MANNSIVNFGFNNIDENKNEMFLQNSINPVLKMASSCLPEIFTCDVTTRLGKYARDKYCTDHVIHVMKMWIDQIFVDGEVERLLFDKRGCDILQARFEKKMILFKI